MDDEGRCRGVDALNLDDDSIHRFSANMVIVEDYVSTRWLNLTLQIAVKFLCFLGAAASALATIRIALGP